MKKIKFRNLKEMYSFLEKEAEKRILKKKRMLFCATRNIGAQNEARN
jgi:hypothetical protein